MQRNHGIDVNGEKICALLYADDLLIIGQSAEQLQDLLDSMYGWCRKWKLLINADRVYVSLGTAGPYPGYVPAVPRET